jgi:hypothetical protein
VHRPSLDPCPPSQPISDPSFYLIKNCLEHPSAESRARPAFFTCMPAESSRLAALETRSIISNTHRRSTSYRMAIVHASTPAAPLSAKIPQVTGQKKNGKNWHENKAAFRPLAGQTSYAKRAEKQKQENEVKKMEKEMKEEKEQERQVCSALEIMSQRI